MNAERPLCVDLDGTLLRTDTLHEALCALLKHKPWLLVLLPLWLLGGKAVFKRRIFEQISLDPALLPYHRQVLEFLRQEHERGRELVLVTACDSAQAGAIAEHLGLFSRVFASDGECNMRGERKRELLEREFGTRGFDYLGNEWSDMPAWRAAERQLVVGGSIRLRETLHREGREVQEFEGNDPTLAVLIRALRVHQWVKNLLVFVPVLMAHHLFIVHELLTAVWAFVVFCICCSGVYILNDLCDLESDRVHPSKRRRPFASGALPIHFGFVLAPLLLGTAFIFALWLPPRFVLLLGLYLAATFAYSHRLKQIVLIDIVVLAGLYSLRVLAGAVATGVYVSPWLLAFSLFMFFSLACGKRFSELYRLKLGGHTAPSGRGYLPADLEAVAQFGSASGFMSVLVLALYINSVEVQQLYPNRSLLWLLCPVLLYWVSRVWLLTHRGELHEDPIVFAIRDKVSYVVGALFVLILLAAKGL